jgi:L-lactate utilization protein LutC
MVESFLTAAAENACGTHGPYAPGDAADVVVGLAAQYAAGRAVVLTDEAVVVALDLESRLRAEALDLLRPADPAWSARLPDAGVAVTGCVLGVAATGSVVLAAAPGTPRAASLAPPAHVCLLRAGDIVATLDEAMARLGGGELPSAWIWVGGPSRTSDLEMRPTIGIHGPRTVDVVVLAT